MVAYVSQNIAGVDLTAIYPAINLVTAPETPAFPFKLGELVTATDGSEWVFATTTQTLTNGMVVMIGSSVAGSATGNYWNAVGIGGTGGLGVDTAAQAGTPAFYQNATSLTTGQAAWFMIRGAPTILVASSSVISALYTTDITGTLTGVSNTASHYQVSGLTCVVTA